MVRDMRRDEIIPPYGRFCSGFGGTYWSGEAEALWAEAHGLACRNEGRVCVPKGQTYSTLLKYWKFKNFQ